MNASEDTKSVQGIEQQLSAICMSAHMSSEALHDARLAGKILDGIAWVCGKFTRPAAEVFATPSPKH
jgi:hypothetical protein